MDVRATINNYEKSRFIPHNDEKENLIVQLYTKQMALNEKREIYRKLRGFNNRYKRSYIDIDYVLEMVIAESIDLKPDEIINDYYHLEANETHSDADRQKINRIKRKIKSICSNTTDYLNSYLLASSYFSFSIDELDIYIHAIEYFYMEKEFVLSRVKNRHKKENKSMNWNELNIFLSNNNNVFTGNDLSFLSSFAKKYNISRNTVNRLFINFGKRECFSIADINHIINSLSNNNKISPNYDINMFFQDLKIIKESMVL